ncbi:serine peptidase [Betaproteobacteria bacterium GR16-43]|nr:serine peptidase [Betaproteobacteria bacterium GR16-43]
MSASHTATANAQQQPAAAAPAPLQLAQAPVQTASGAQMQMLPDFADLVEKYGPAVVNINTSTRKARSASVPGLSEDDPFYEFFRRFMPPEARPGPEGRGPRGGEGKGATPERRGPPRALGLGSGFVISPDGYIVTNAHVIENADEITVRFTDKREFKAKVIGADKRSDVAVIKVEASGLPSMKIGNSTKARVGEWVIAIGSPFGFSNTVTAGIISATSRENLSDPNMDAVPFIQTDVAVNPGNSGGPLLNLRGEVIGINSQIFSQTGSFAGISFAIPIDFAMNVANQIQAGGKVTRGRIGVQITAVSKDVAESLGLPKAQGAIVQRLEEDSPAAKGGVEAGDVVLKIDGRTIEGNSDLSRYVRQVKPGTKINMQVWREGKTKDLVVTVGELKEEGETRVASAKGTKPEVKTTKLGVAVTDLKDDVKKKLKVTGGVEVEAVDGAALAAGIQPGDVILRVNNTGVTSVKSFNDAISKIDVKKPVTLLVADENGTRLVPFRPEEG